MSNDKAVTTTFTLGQTNLVKVLLLFYLITASNCTENLLSKQTQQIINDNRYVQHLLGFMTLFVLITLIDDQIDTRTALIYTVIGYVLFVFSTKIDIHYSFVIVMLLFIAYMYDNSSKIRTNEIKNDDSIPDEMKDILLKNSAYIDSTILWIIIGIVIVGTFFYSQKKQEQYGGGYDVFTYFLQ